METRRIGPLEVSAVGLGCNNFGWRIDAGQATAVVHGALESGITFFDTADIYGGTRSEEFLGRALGARRQQVVIATKFGAKVDDARRGARPAYVRRAVEDSLRRLGTDWIDLYQLHRPDPTVPVGDTLEALDGLVQAGKVRAIGCSNFSAPQIVEARAAARPGATRFVSVQNEYSLLRRDAERDVLPECEREGLAFLPYFPLASGLLTGKVRSGQPAPKGTRLGDVAGVATLVTPRNVDMVDALQGFARSRGHTLLELAISWLLAHAPVSSVIAGATSVEQVQENARAVGWRLGPDDLEAVDRLTSV